jgi:hypothetical protein
MYSGTAAGADKPITLLVLETLRMIGSASATLMMSRAAKLAHQQDGYTYAAASRFYGMKRSDHPTCRRSPYTIC